MADMHKVICMNREFGCCGSQIASEAAKRLGIGYYDSNLKKMAIEYGGIEPDVLDHLDEQAPNLAFYKRVSIGNEKAPKDTTYHDVLFALQSEVLKNLAKEKDFIVVGRCATYVLREEPVKMIRVKLTGSKEFKIKQVMKEEGLNALAASKLIRKKEGKRKDNYYYFTKESWSDPQSYDIHLNVDRLGVEGCINVLCGLYNSL